MDRSLLRRVAVAAVTVLCAVNVYIYNYAALRARGHPRAGVRFGLYGDPQIEGSAKLVREPRTGRYDLLFNDYYLRHVYTSTITAFEPEYVVTMGDIFSSQWVRKTEYHNRIRRFSWIAGQVNTTHGKSHAHLYLAGNHDIGYGNETRKFHIDRFTKSFGPLNWSWSADVPGAGRHRFTILNAMNLDGTREEQFRNETWGYVQQLAKDRSQDLGVPLALFLHVPLDKPGGICAVAPITKYNGTYVTYQDYLSPTTSAYILHCLAPVAIFSGHDHDGCLAGYVVRNSSTRPVALGGFGKTLHASSDLCQLSLPELDNFQAEIEEFARDTIDPVSSSDMPALAEGLVVEVTVRSTMGSYGGATGILDISSSSSSSSSNGGVHARGREFTLSTVAGFQYHYREIQLGSHIIPRVLLVATAVCACALPAILLW